MRAAVQRRGAGTRGLTAVTSAIRAYRDRERDDLVRISLQAFAPIHESIARILGPAIDELVYPDWRASQVAELDQVLADPLTSVWVAVADGWVRGFVAVGINADTHVGEVQLIAVAPEYQNRGVGGELNEFALRHMTNAGMWIATLGTGGDPSHAPARRSYESVGYTALPLVRFYKRLASPEPAAADASADAESLDPVAVSVAVYTDSADQYEAIHAPKMADRAERFAGSLPEPSLILDAGCGPGRDLARFHAHGHVARGIDLNPAFVRKANTIAPTSMCDLRVVGDRFPDAMFDGIWAASSLVHLREDDAVSVLRQFARLLRPGGKLFVGVKCAGESGWLEEPDGRRWYNVWDPQRLAAVVADAGFSVDVVDHDVFVEIWASRRD